MLKHKIEQINDIRVLVLEGQASITERDELMSLLDNEKGIKENNYILDLSKVYYIDSFGISFLQQIILGENIRKNLIIVSSKDYIDYVIRFNKIDKLLSMKFVHTIEEAVKTFSNS